MVVSKERVPRMEKLACCCKENARVAVDAYECGSRGNPREVFQFGSIFEVSTPIF